MMSLIRKLSMKLDHPYNPYKYIRPWVHRHVWRHTQDEVRDMFLDLAYTDCSCGWWF